MTREGVGIVQKVNKKRAIGKKTLFFNQGHSGATGTNTFAKDDGTCFIDANQTATTIVYPLSDLIAGDRINAFRVLGALGAKASNATVVDADLRKVTKGAGAVTDASVGAITQVSVEADTALDSEKSGLTEEIKTDYQYYVLVTITTAADATNDVSLIGVEVDVNQ